MSWRFRTMSRGDLNIDPMEHEFFATETLENITGALVREAIQNSLDAAAGDCVSVRFCLGRAGPAVGSYLGDLWRHAEAATHTEVLPRPDEPLTFLAVEDHGTRGLEGDPAQYEDAANGHARNDFYYFWRNVGRSQKETTERGRWGLGKTVFAAASRLHAFFGLTHRAADGRRLLMGQAVLRVHRLGGHRYQPYGYYANHGDDLPMPFDAARTVDAFAKAFSLHREGGPGLSIVVPYPDPEITAEGLVRAVLMHYFHPLLAGRLRVVIEESGRAIELHRDGLEREISRFGDGSLRGLLPMIQLARWSLESHNDTCFELAPPAKGRAPKLVSDLFDDESLARMRRLYDEGRRLSLGIPVWVLAANEDAKLARFVLHMERDDKAERGEGHFVRQGITIENASARRPRGVRWLVVTDDPALSAFLGDAENPAHTEWQRASTKFRGKYDLGPSTIDFVRTAPYSVAAILSRPAEGEDRELLRHIFSIADEPAMETNTREKRAAGWSEEVASPKPEFGELGQGGKLALSPVKRGFRLKGRVGEHGPRRLVILAAYEVLRGDAFVHYSPHDFRLDSEAITVVLRGARMIARQENWFAIEIVESVFDVVAAGFDENRDLRIKVEPLREEP